MPNTEIKQIDDSPTTETAKTITRRILLGALEVHASDIHIEPYEDRVRLRYRVDGELRECDPIPKNEQNGVIAQLKTLCGCNPEEHRLPQDGRMRIRAEGRDVDWRLGFMPSAYGEGVVLRLLEKYNTYLDLNKFGFDGQPLDALNRALQKPHGLIIVAGPTGSGKSTTLYAVLNKLNTPTRKIVSLEDPIEYYLDGVMQTQIHAEIGLTFSEAMRQTLRHDPDVILLGEIRDAETADIAVKAAITGRLVLTILHANDAAGVFQRLIDVGVEPFLVQSAMTLSVAQRLLRRVCGECRENSDIPKDVLNKVQFMSQENGDKPTFVRGRGCAACRNTGYKGRIAVIEALENAPEIGELLLQGAPSQEIKKLAVKRGMRTLRQNALAKAAQGVTTIEQVLEVTSPD